MSEGRGGQPGPHVTYLLSDLGGGTGHHLISLLEFSGSGRWSADIVSEAANTSRVAPSVPLEVLRPSTRLRFPLAQMRRWRALRARMLETRPDILHTYFFWSIVYGRLLRAEGVVPNLIENREDLGFNWGPMEYRFLRLTRSVPDRVICVSEAVRSVVLEREGISPDRAVVIRNGVGPSLELAADSGRRLREEFDIPTDALLVGMVANFQRPIKGAVYFVEALAPVVRAVPDAYFMLIGMGDNQEDLQQRADMAGAGTRLIFTGFRDDVDRFYDAMDVSALTSLSEGLSITLLESMRRGVPVVATDVGGNAEVVQHGETGFLVPARDPDAFARKIIELARNPELRRSFGMRARERIQRNFSMRGVADAYASIYRELAVRSSA